MKRGERFAIFMLAMVLVMAPITGLAMLNRQTCRNSQTSWDQRREMIVVLTRDPHFPLAADPQLSETQHAALENRHYQRTKLLHDLGERPTCGLLG